MSLNRQSHNPASIIIRQTDLPITIGGYAYDRATPADLQAIIAIYKEQYGDGYPYIPTENDIQNHLYYKATAVHSGEVHGINRAYVVNPETGDYEFGGAVVLKQCRGKGVGKNLTTIRWGGLSDLKVRRIYSEPVNNDPTNASLNNITLNARLHITGVFPGKHPSLSNVAGGQALTTSDAFWVDISNNNGSRTIDIDRMNIPEDYREALKALIDSELWEKTEQSRVVPENYGRLIAKETPPKGEGGSASVTLPVNHVDSRTCIAEFRKRGYLLRGLLLADKQIGPGQWIEQVMTTGRAGSMEKPLEGAN